jgi:hypothetical protein
MWTTSKRERERERKEEERERRALHYHHNHKNIYVWISKGGEEITQALLTVQSTRTYHTHYLMEFCILLSITLNDSKFVREDMSKLSQRRTGLITPSNSRQSCSNKGIRSIYIEEKDSIAVTSFTSLSLFLCAQLKRMCLCTRIRLRLL